MHALTKTDGDQTTGGTRLPPVSAELERIAAFARHVLCADDAAVILDGQSRDVDPVRRELRRRVVAAGGLIAIPDAGMDGGAVAGVLGIPIRDSGREIVGALVVTTRAVRLWSQSDQQLLEFFCTDVESHLNLRRVARAEARRAREQRLLAREYHHRIRNAYSVASAVVVLSAVQGASIQSLIETTSAQLAALADAHTAIGFEQDEAELSVLIGGALKPYSFSTANVRADGPAVMIAEDKVVSLSLIINELATNSTKYGALRLGGSVDLNWTKEAGKIVLRWTEVAAEPRRGQKTRSGSFGGTMVELSVSQLDATLHREWKGDGLTVTLAFTL